MSITQSLIDNLTEFHDRAAPQKDTLTRAVMQLAVLGNIYSDELIEYIQSLYIEDNIIYSSDWQDTESIILQHLRNVADNLRTVANNLDQLVTEQALDKLA